MFAYKTKAVPGMFEEIKKRLNLNHINDFTREECEDRLMLLRYLIRRENTPKITKAFQDYIDRIETRLNMIQDEES